MEKQAELLITSKESPLNILEQTHRDRCGTNRLFCYVESHWWGNLYKLSFVEEDESGHFPISDDIVFGTKNGMRELANELNRRRLGLTPRSTMAIVASSMSGSRHA